MCCRIAALISSPATLTDVQKMTAGSEITATGVFDVRRSSSTSLANLRTNIGLLFGNSREDSADSASRVAGGPPQPEEISASSPCEPRDVAGLGVAPSEASPLARRRADGVE